jgi:rod shape-determining protein MreC
MEFILNRYRNLTVLLLVVVGQLLLLAYQVKNNQDVRMVRVWAVTAVTPLARILEVVRRNTIGIAEDYFVLIHVRDENVRLNRDIGNLKMENQYLKTELQTADRAQALRAFQTRSPSRTLAARIIGNGTGTNSMVVFIDRGSTSGVMRGMAVVTPDGIVGRVLASYPTASQVLLITDPTFAAGVISEKNRIKGTLKGLGQAKILIDYVQNEEKVDLGEMFYTSGDDRVFPKGMPVGRATVVRSGKNFKEIYVDPSGMQNGLEEVLVVIEGVHQDIPDSTAMASTDMHLQSAPPANPKSAAASTDPAAGLQTDADRLRDKYKKIGAAQGHVYGEGFLGQKPLNFNLNPDAPKPPTVARKAPVQLDANGNPILAPPKPKLQLDANGNPVPAPFKPGVQPRFDADGNPLPPAVARPKPQPTLDANGNPLPPAVVRPKPQPTLDANGNPLPPVVRPAPKLDANGNPLPPIVRPKPQPRLDANGNPIPPAVVQPRPQLDANGNFIPPVRKPAPKLDANGNPIPVVARPRLDANGNPLPPAVTSLAKPTVKPQPKLDANGKSSISPANVPPGSRVTSNHTTINVVTPAPKAKPKPATEAPPNQ